MSKLEELSRLEQDALGALQSQADSEALAAWRREYLGKKGFLTLMLRAVRELPKEERQQKCGQRTYVPERAAIT